MRPRYRGALLSLVVAGLLVAGRPLPATARDAGGPAGPRVAEDATESAGSRALASLRSKIRGLRLRLSTGVGFDDNVRRTETARRSAFFTQARPAASLQARFGKHAGRIEYEGNVIVFPDLGDENLADHRLSTTLDLDLHRKLDATLEASYQRSQDPRAGSDVRLRQSAEPDRWNRTRVAGEAVLGRRIARAQIGLAVDYSELRFTNNAQETRDRDDVSLRLTGYWNIGPKLSLVAQPSVSEVDFVFPVATGDSRELDFLAGLRWEATFKTTGEFKIGYREKNFDDPREADFSGLGWTGQVIWERKSFSVVTLTTSRDTQESTLAGSNLVNNHLEVAWRHGFTRRLTLETGLSFDRAEFSNGREDDQAAFRAELSYSLLRWLGVGGSYRHTRRASTSPGADFTNNVLLVNVVAELSRGGGTSR